MSRRDAESPFPRDTSSLAGEPTTESHMSTDGVKVTSAIRRHAGRDHDGETEFERTEAGKRFWKK